MKIKLILDADEVQKYMNGDTITRDIAVLRGEYYVQ